MVETTERKRFAALVGMVALAFMLALLVVRAYAGPEEMPGGRPSAALYAITWRSTVLTVDTNSTAYLTQAYSYHDLFCTIDHNLNQTMSVQLQVSPDNSDWYDAIVLTATVISDGAVFTRALSYGRYTRLVFDVQTANQITPTCKSVFFNNWTPASYAGSIP